MTEADVTGATAPAAEAAGAVGTGGGTGSESATAAQAGPGPLEAGTYEVLRARLADRSRELAGRAEALNQQRLAVFGGTEMRLLGTERIRTEHNCVPRDIVSVGDRMLLGYNVFFGLKPETTVADVFSLHRFVRDGDSYRFEPGAGDADLIDDDGFRRDFAELYRYYREARLLQLRLVEGMLLAVFQTGPRLEDIRVPRWRIAPGGKATYLDSRGERDHRFPPPHDFEWTETTRDDHVSGRHPHISIAGEVFVETVGGDLTIKIENNTETGAGIYAEPVAEPLQSLADAEVAYARVGPLILLRIRPYKETDWRYVIFNTRTKDVVRLDGIGQSCQRLPEDQGIIFPGGYYLTTGVTKTFDAHTDDLEFERVIRSPNGEDVLYAYHARAEGRTLLLPYNVIRKQATTPLNCHGYSLFDDGTLVVFRATSDEPTRVHPMQVWATPYVSDTHAAAQPIGDSAAERVGNADLVRGISDCLSIAGMVDEMRPSAPVFEALIAACARAFDHYHWLGDTELGDLRSPLSEVRAAAEQVLDEFEKVQQLARHAAGALAAAETEVSALIRQSGASTPASTDAWVRQIAELRTAQGRLVTLREQRYIDVAAIDALAARLAEAVRATAGRAVEFLRGEEAFTTYLSDLERLSGRAAAIATVAEAAPIADELTAQSDGLQVVTDTIGSLDIADTVVRTAILEQVGTVLGAINRTRATLQARRRELVAAEGRAGFAAELALLAQAITGALATADTVDKCDEQLARLLLQLENLEARFGDFDDFLAELADRRTDVYEAFSARRQGLVDERLRRADRLMESASRILGSVHRRSATLATLDEVNTYFAADPMVAKVRSIVDDLRTLDDAVRAEELDGRLKAARQEAARALRDRIDLYRDGGESIQLGQHRFAVNTQPIGLSVVPHDGRMTVAITGTDYRAPLPDEAFAGTEQFWDERLVSESPTMARAEYLATSILAEAESDPARMDELRAAAADGTLGATVRAVAESRYDEGYERGVHDADATAILAETLRLHAGAGLLRFPPLVRAAATLFWAHGATDDTRDGWARTARSLGRARELFAGPGVADGIDRVRGDMAAAIDAHLASAGLPELAAGAGAAADYLFEELAAGAGFVSSARARDLLARFRAALGGARSAAVRSFDDDLRAVGPDMAGGYRLVCSWVAGYVAASGTAADRYDLPEAVTIALCGANVERYESSAAVTATVPGLLSTHPRIVDRQLDIRLDELLDRARSFRHERVPAFRAYHQRRNDVAARQAQRLRLDELRPKVMDSFVRNRLIDEVYLPLVAGNLARQLGASGDAKRVDQMGLLMLISPPGYGKTTLMEYIASRLGLIFVKVNGPALGAGVTSLDPDEAPNATARQEVQKVSFALEMGNNVLLYLDDIQHTSPEFLQKFISLCDAQRRIEGVWDGRTRTYDLRGKRFAVCMAGNPYTESGSRFRVPDMLANRADVWNIGDVLSGREDLFALSYIENALTANPVLAPLSARGRGDIDVLVRLAAGDAGVNPDQLEYPYPAVELDEILSVLGKLLRVQRVVLASNRAYIASAARSDASRTEPPYLLQGSYRNMNKLAERVVSVMDDEDLEALIDDHYLGEAQTLAAGAEENLLKFAELRGRMTEAQAARWTEVKAGYLRARALGGDDDDPMRRALGALGLLADRVGGVEAAIERARGTL